MTTAEYLNAQINETIRVLTEAQQAIKQGNVTIATAKLDTAKAEINHVSDKLAQALR
jgi:hypothetical protein